MYANVCNPLKQYLMEVPRDKELLHKHVKFFMTAMLNEFKNFDRLSLDRNSNINRSTTQLVSCQPHISANRDSRVPRKEN